LGKLSGKEEMKNRINIVLIVSVCLASSLACNKFTELVKNASNSSETKNTEKTRLPSAEFSLEGKEWKFSDIKGTDISIEMPGEPIDRSPKPEQLPPSYKAIFSGMHISALDERGLSIAASQLDPTGKRKFTIKELADTSMQAMKRQLPDLKYELEVTSETKAKYTGTFTKNGREYDVRGCCLYKKADPLRVWAIITYFDKTNGDARTAAQRAIDGVKFAGGTDTCN